MESQTLDRTAEQRVARLEAEIWTELKKIDPEQRRSVEAAGLEAMRDCIAKRVRCLTTGQDCEAQIGGLDIGWF
jgi:hypothetical protein